PVVRFDQARSLTLYQDRAHSRRIGWRPLAWMQARVYPERKAAASRPGVAGGAEMQVKQGGNGRGASPRAILQSDSGLDLTSDFWMHRHFRAMAAIYNSLLNEANLLPGDHILDLGCGTGTHFDWIANLI